MNKHPFKTIQWGRTVQLQPLSKEEAIRLLISIQSEMKFSNRDPIYPQFPFWVVKIIYLFFIFYGFFKI